MTDTELLFNNITPQNLKDNETIYKLLKLYNSSFEDSFEILENPLYLLDTDFLIKQYEATSNTGFDDIKREIFKIHLQEIFQTFEEIGDSEEIYNKFKGVYESLNIPTDELKIVADIDKSIDSQYINASRSFKTKKGTRSGFFFVYDIINRAGIQAINSDAFFDLIEGTDENPNTPYEYTVKTSLYKEVFQKTVVPLAHPVGFKWNFIRLLFLTLEDYFGLEEAKTLSETLLTCYGSSESSINQLEIVNSGVYGTVKNFFIMENQNKEEQIIIDYNPLDGTEDEGLRLLRDYNGLITLFDRQSVKKDESTNEIQYLEIEDIRLVQTENGFLSLNKIQRTFNNETFEVIESMGFKEYTIIDKEYIEIEYKIKGDFKNNWNISKLYLTKKIVSDDIKFFEIETFSRQDILDGSSSYNGRIVNDMGINCKLNYDVIYTYRISTKDVSEHIESIRPNTINLKKNVNDINIPQSEYNIAISEGRDPYEGLYCTLDHTVQELDFKDTHENFGRLSIGNIPRQYSPYKANEHKIIGETGLIIDDNTSIDSNTDWRIDWHELHIQDIGFNSNDNRWENYFIPDAQDSLTKTNSPLTLQRYIKDNLEWYGDKGSGTMPNNFGIDFLPSTAEEEQSLKTDIESLSQDYNTTIKLKNNGEYLAWESYTSIMKFKIHTSSVYKFWSLNSGEHTITVDAEVYKYEWKYDNSSDDIFTSITQQYITDTLTEHGNDIADKESLEIVIEDNDTLTEHGNDMADKESLETDFNINKKIINTVEFIDDMYSIGDDINVDTESFYIGMILEKIIYTDSAEIYGEVPYGGIIPAFGLFSDLDDFSFGVYRDDELLDDNNVSAA